MFKSQDIAVGLKIIANPQLPQNEVAKQVGTHAPQVTRSIKILQSAKLLFPRYGNDKNLLPNFYAWEKVLLAVEYLFPVTPSGLVVGIPTSHGAKPISDIILPGSDPLPVWPSANGKVKGLCVAPLHPGIPMGLEQYPDENFYTLLVLIDALRIGRAREKELGKKYLFELLEKLEAKVTV